MTDKDQRFNQAAALRRRAEALASEKAPTAADITNQSPEEIRKTFHELHVHQLELEMQNEELRRVQTELDATRMRYFELYDLAPVGYLTLSSEGLILEANLTAATLLGVGRGTLTRQPFARFIVKEDQDIFYLGRKPNACCEPHTCDLRMTRADGTVFWAHLVIIAMQQLDGHSVCQMVLSDITERKRAEEDLRESEERYRLLFASASDAVLLLATDTGLILNANQMAVELYGYTLEELLTKKCLDLSAEVEKSCRIITEARSNPGALLKIPLLQHRKKNGTIFPVEISARIFPLKRWSVILIAIRDISERIQVEAVTVARFRLLQSAGAHSLAEFLQATLDEAETLTGSQIGFYHFITPDQTMLSMQAWSTNTLAGMCKAEATGLHYPIKQAGVWTDCVHERKPVIHNEYATLPHRKGIPPGHVPIVRELVVPVMRGETLVAILGVGNKPTDYTQQDIEAVAPLADLAWDIAERKLIEEALRESEERYRLMFDAAADAMFLIDTDTTLVIKANQRAAELYGYAEEELLAKKSEELSAEPEDTNRRIREARTVPGQRISIPLRLHRKKDGTIFPVEITARTIPLKGQQVLLVAVRDITKRKQMEEALRHNEQAVTATNKFLALVLDTVPVRLFWKDCNCVYVGCNRLFAQDAGFQNPEDLIGVDDYNLVWREQADQYRRDDVEVMASKQPKLKYEEIQTIPNGQTISVSTSKVPLLDPQGVVIGVLGTYEDITQRKWQEAQLNAAREDLEHRVEQRTRELQETQKQYLHAEKLSAIGKLSASIAHEFNNPLQGILSILKGLKKRAILEKEDRELLDAAIAESDRIKELIRSLQDFNRPTSGRAVFMDVHKAIDSLLLLHKSDLKGRRISVVRDYAERLPQIFAVSDQIKQVFLNLLTNAADACPLPGGEITISTRQEDDRVAVAFKDTGIGIKSGEMERIFQPFYTTKPAVKGTGLGLSVSYGIVKNHQGEIRVESQPGAGATFTVLLPIKGVTEAGASIDR